MTAVLAGGIEKLNQYVITDLVQSGTVDMVNEEGRCFIKKGW